MAWVYKGIGDDVGGTFGGATRGGNFESTRGSKGFDYEEAIIATGGESSMNTRKVQREEDKSAPIIRISIEIVAVGSSNVRIPNPNQAPRSTFMW